MIAEVIAAFGELAEIERLDMRNDGEVENERAVEDLRQPRRPFQILDPGCDADLGELRGEYLAALPRVSRRRQLEAEFEWRGDTGFRQQLLGLLRIVGVDVGGVDIAERAGDVEAADRGAETVGAAFDHGLAIDRGENGAADADVVERLLPVVDGDDGLGL